MALNRKLQREILQALEETYPDSLLVAALPGFDDTREFMANLFYLQEHGLIDGGDIREPGRCRSMVDAQITHTGLDFLADDGGLQAVFGRFTVRFTAAELMDILDRILCQEGIESGRKSTILKTLGEMEGEALKYIISRLVETGARQDIDFLTDSAKKGVVRSTAETEEISEDD